MPEHFDYVVVGLGALGSATAAQLAGRGHSVVGLERFALGHHRGASHDTSRILRHSYHTPEYVRLTCDAYDDWARLEADSDEQLVTVTGGLDLFPPDPAIPLDDYVRSLTEVGIPHELLDVAAIRARWPQFDAPGRDRGAVPGARRDRPGRSRHRGHAAAGGPARSRARATSRAVTGLRDLGAGGVEVRTETTTYRCRAVVVCADAWTNDVLASSGPPHPAHRHAGAGDVLRARGARAASRRAGCRCGSGWTSRRSTASPATASPRSRRPRTAADRDRSGSRTDLDGGGPTQGR